MKKLLTIITLLIITILPAYGQTPSLNTGILENGVPTNNFSVRLESNNVYWEGGFHVSEKLSDDIYSLFIAVYDGNRLAAVESVNIDEGLSGFAFSEQCIRLSYAPQSITVKAMAISRDGKFTPLSTPVTVSAQASAEPAYSVNSSLTSFYFDIYENTIDFILDENNVYISGNAVVSTQGNAEYKMLLNVKLAGQELWKDEILLDSRFNKFSVNEKIDVDFSEDLYMEIDFIYNGNKLTPTVIKGNPPFPTEAKICVAHSIGIATNPFDGLDYNAVAYYTESSYGPQYAYSNEPFDLEKGDMFICTTDQKGIVDKYAIVFDMSNYITDKGVSVNSFAPKNYSQPDNITFAHSVYTTSPLPEWNTDKSKNQARIGMGVILSNNNGESLTIGKVIDNKTDTNDNTMVSTINLANEISIYVYDLNARATEMVEKGSFGSLNPTFLAQNYITNGVYDWAAANKTHPKSAFFKTLNNQITDILVVIPKSS